MLGVFVIELEDNVFNGLGDLGLMRGVFICVLVIFETVLEFDFELVLVLEMLFILGDVFVFC